jgi:hypothetical protein
MLAQDGGGTEFGFGGDRASVVAPLAGGIAAGARERRLA